jgi:hypothetical protein
VRVAGVVFLATGAAAIAGGLVLGAVAASKNHDANAVCAELACTSENGVTLAREAGQFATASTITFFSGVGLAAAGVLMVVLPPRSPASKAAVSVAPTANHDGGGLLVRGSF